MRTAIGKITAAATLAVLSLGAQASAVTLDFNSLIPAGATAPVAVGTSQVGFTFSGAYAWNTGIATETNDPKPGDLSNTSGFIVNKNRGADAGDIELLLSGSNTGKFFKLLSFDLFVTQTTPVVEAHSVVNGVDHLIESFSLTPGDGNKLWSTASLREFTALEQVNRLVIGTRSGTPPAPDFGILGMDNLNIDFIASTNGGGGGTAPEPASYALVGIALLAAGTASRRRKA
jgi:hypothetical protein